MDTDGQIVDRIYEAALVPELWPQVLEQLCVAADGRGGALAVVASRQGLNFIATDRYEAPYQSYALAGGGYRNIRAERFIARRESAFLTDLELCSRDELSSDGLYRDFLRPFGLGWTVGTAIMPPGADLVMFDLCRLETDGPFTRAAAEALDLYRPHLARAALLSAQLSLQRAAVTVETLGRVGLPAAVLRESGTVAAANAQFEAMAAGFAIGARDRVVIDDPAANALLGAALDASLHRRTGDVLSIPVAARADRPALVLHLLPVRRSGRDIFAQAAFTLLITPVAAPQAPLAELLQALFDLTPAETRLARALAGGNSTTDVARLGGLSRETVRKQLQSVFGKTGTRRQADLLRLLAGLGPIGSTLPGGPDAPSRA